MAEKTLSELRQACSKADIRLKKETMSWGPHVTFIVDGKSISGAGVYDKEFLERNKRRLDRLEQIRIEFAGLLYNDEKVYGI